MLPGAEGERWGGGGPDLGSLRHDIRAKRHLDAAKQGAVGGHVEQKWEMAEARKQSFGSISQRKIDPKQPKKMLRVNLKC